MRLIIYLITYLVLFLSNTLIFSQNKTYDLILWDQDENCRLFLKNIDSNSIYKSISAVPLGVDSSYLVYYGKLIGNPYEFKLPYNPLYKLGMTSFFPYNDSLEIGKSSNPSPAEIHKDTSLKDICIRLKDDFPDGLWLNFVKDSTGLFIESQKIIKNGFIDGEAKTWYNNSHIRSISNFNKGQEERGVFFSKDGYLLSKSTFTCNVMDEKTDYFHGTTKVCRYYNYNWGGVGFYENGNIREIRRTYKGITHGEYIEFNENGELVSKDYYNLGKLYKSCKYDNVEKCTYY